MMRRSIYS